MAGKLPSLSHLISLALLFALAGCGPLVEFPGQGEEAPVYYELTPDRRLVVKNAEIPWMVFIEEPSMAQSLRRERIAVKPEADRLEYLAGAQWSDRAPDMIRRFVVESLENSGLVTAVGAESLDLPTEYRLRMDVRDFEAVFYPDPARPKINIRFAVMLIRTAPVEIIDTRTFQTSVSADNNNADAIVSAFNRSMNSIMGDVTDWIGALQNAS